MILSNNLRAMGHSLLECCIAMVLISAMMNILIKQYMQMKQQVYRMNHTLDEAMETHLAIGVMRDRIRRAGFTPCGSFSQLVTVDARRKRVSLLPISLIFNGFMIQRMAPYFVEIEAKPHASLLYASQPITLSIGQSVMIADCMHAEVHQIIDIRRDTNRQLIQIEKPLIYDYSKPVYLASWIEEQFRVKSMSSHATYLFYQNNRTDILTNQIKGLNVELDRHHVHLQCLLENKKMISVVTRVRSL